MCTFYYFCPLLLYNGHWTFVLCVLVIKIDFKMDNTEEINQDSKTYSLPESKSYSENGFRDDRYSALKLYEFDYPELPKLLDPILPKTGLASLVGSSDTGKSTFLRQLALSVAMGLDKFVGYKLISTSRNVIYVSTEDDPTSTSFSIKKPINKLLKEFTLSPEVLKHLKFIFDVDTNPDSPHYIIKVLESDLENQYVDLIIVDAFTDIFSGDINSSTKVREFLNNFSKLAKKKECLILFLHHTGKRTDKFTASKDNVLGSQAFEAKMRVLIELKHYPNNESLRSITITKGNYISSQIKKFSKIIKFNEDDLIFEDTGESVLSDSISSIVRMNPKKEEILPLIQSMQSTMSLRQIEMELKKRGYKIGKSTVANYLSEIKSAKIIEEKGTTINKEPEFNDIDLSVDLGPPEFTL